MMKENEDRSKISATKFQRKNKSVGRTHQPNRLLLSGGSSSSRPTPQREEMVEIIDRMNLIHPLRIDQPTEITQSHIELLRAWATIRGAVEESFGVAITEDIENREGKEAWHNAKNLTCHIKHDLETEMEKVLGKAIWQHAWLSVADAITAYTASLEPICELFSIGLVPFRNVLLDDDGEGWGLYSRNGIVWEGQLK